ncbi:hypothetical protein Micbo1qcDRAFT_186716 [Microdochium bolleyi]|uniref:DNA 3'-5' helicase n=1 Tax=Microdochium bolleyi TaxID=196109 RepID=A0A136IKW9_9PEZI|nr:hypothetical protein Micbo1qcDRAFT_186716 [Microdochium bolleyi]
MERVVEEDSDRASPPAGGLADPYLADLPADGSAPIPQLAVQAGFSCGACRYLTTSQQLILQHWAASRAGSSAEGGGRQQHEGPGRWTEVALQSFSAARQLRRYWVVDVPAPGRGGPVDAEGAGPAPEPGPRVHTESGWEAYMTAHEARVAAEDTERRRTISYDAGVDFESPWVRQMGWAAHLAGKDIVELWHAARQGLTPRELAKLGWVARKEREASEGALVRLGQSFDREIARYGRRITQVPAETLCWLASRDPQQPSPLPFSLKQEAATTERYQSYWRRYLCLCVRVSRLGRSGAREQYRIQFNDDQWAALEAVAEALDRTRKKRSRVGGDRGSKDHGGGGSGGGDDDNDNDEKLLDTAVFTFCITSLTQKVLVQPYANPLLHFTTVLAVDPDKARFRGAETFTTQLAGIAWCSRVLLLEYLFEDIPIREDARVDIGDRDESCDQEARRGVRQLQARDISAFMEGYRQWIADGTYSPFSTITRFMTIGKGYRLKEGGIPRIIWEDGKNTVRLHGSRIEVQDFRRMAQGLVAAAESALDRLLYGRSAVLLDRAGPGRISDSVMYEGDGRSFVTNPQNEWLRAGPRTVGELLSSKLWWPQRQQFYREKSQRWLHRLATLRSQLLLLTHIWGGQPGRGPEVTSVRYMDTKQLSRSVYVFDGQVMLVTDRDKAKSIRGYGRKVARFLPDRIGRLLIVYIAWLIPFEEMLLGAIRARKPSESLRHWLWKDGCRGRWGTEVLTKELKAATASYLGVELGTAAYRHLAIELGRTIQGLVVQQQELEVGAADDGSGLENGDVDEATGEPRQRARTELVWDLQATHGSAVARSRYAVNIQFPGQLQPQLIANYREISRLWHQAPGEEAEEGVYGVGIDIRGRRAAGGQERHNRAGAARGLESFFGTGARWRTAEQEQAMARVMQMRGGSVLIVVLPTGGGKSLLFMVPAARGVNGGVSIVVVPFVALIDDLVSRARSFGIDCVRWRAAEEEGREAGSLARVAGLVVVSADQASNYEFCNYADALRSRNLLRRIFIDECHTIIMDIGYRERLGGLKGLYRYDCPVVLLTATLPVQLEGWFRQQMLAKDAEIIRARTTKRNIRYGVTTVPGRDEVLRLVGEKNGSGALEGDQKGVVYCRSRRDSEKLAERIGCSYYHSGMADLARREVLHRWVSGSGPSRWITATSGLGTGVDISGISVIIHAEEPYGLVDYVQQTGRGGRREGEVVEATIVLAGGAGPGNQKRRQWAEGRETDVERADRLAIEEFVRGTECRRAVLGRFIDGVAGEDCRQIGAVQCDWCENRAGREEGAGDERSSGTDGETGDEVDGEVNDEGAETANRLKEHQTQQQQRRDLLQQWLEEVEGESRCAVCYVRWRVVGQRTSGRESYRHKLESCRVIRKGDYIRWRTGLEFIEGTCCWRCGLGLDWCEKGGKAQELCRWNDKVLPVLMLVQRERLLREAVEDEIEGGLPGMEEWREWIVRPREVLGERMTNGLAVLEAVIREVC